jgi:2-dehydro-3-deoxyphosphogluconate aldolase / (4S)-4-hydroxy-2-oxoglutarate aldolase
MTRETILQRILDGVIVPAVRVASATLALRAVAAIAKGGITTVELPVTIPDVFDAIRALRREYPELLIGAGTVLDETTAGAARLAGAQFIVSPSLHLPVITHCRRYSIPVLPGALTPTEILRAWDAGADMVKVFPASAMGGASYIKALLAPLPHVLFMPMGGVSLDTAAAYLQAGAKALGVGADLVDIAALEAGDDHTITERAKLYVKTVQAARQ